MKKIFEKKKTSNWYFIISGLIFIFGLIEFNKARQLDNGLEVVMTFTAKFIYQLGGSSAVIISHLIVSILLLVFGAYVYRKEGINRK